MRNDFTPIDLDMAELQALLERLEAAAPEQDYQTIKSIVDSYIYVLELLQDQKTTTRELRRILFGPKTEKTRDVLGDTGRASGAADQQPASAADPASKDSAEEASATQAAGASESPKQRKGHGRNGAGDYPGAEHIDVPHKTLKSGDQCPCCAKGKLYNQKPRPIVRLRGVVPVQGTVYSMECFRCNLCGKVMTADPPEGIGLQKYDATVASILGVLRYGNGMPWNRIAQLQAGAGIPMPASTQWRLLNGAAPQLEPVYEHLMREAAQGEVLHNDDTPMTILQLMGKGAMQQAFAQDGVEDDQRTGVFTSGIVSITVEGRQIALFFTGHRHAGENLQRLLSNRSEELKAPIQMCDALSRNMPEELKTILANCLAHGRREFVKLSDLFPDACRHVLEVLKEVYIIDAEAKKENLSAEERLKLHQDKSRPLMDDLHKWLNDQLEQKLAEPNSGLGKAIRYMLKHWNELTLFLREAGAPLDNNICERALKRAILHRKNSLFYKTLRGAYVGDIFMSLIYTCRLCGADPFDYLTQLQRHSDQVERDPGAWMPWNYPVGQRLGQPPPPMPDSQPPPSPPPPDTGPRELGSWTFRVDLRRGDAPTAQAS